jgi:biopolymer transport protein ExbB/TolQ
VQTVYATIIRPKAEALRAADLARMQKDPSYVPALSPFVIVKDPEQETCFIFSLWAIATMALKSAGVARGRKLLGDDLLHLPDGMKILPEDTREYARQIEALPEGVRAQLPAARAENRAASLRCDAQHPGRVGGRARHLRGRARSSRFGARHGAVRGLGDPAIGFVGTVRGIGNSLQQAHKAVEGDVSGVVAGLGTSFNSTLVALSLSIIVMLVLHQVQLRQERLGLDVEEYIDSNVVQNLQVR